VLSKILVERYSPQRLASEFRKRLPELVTHAPEMPRLLHAWLTQQVEGKSELHLHSRDLAELNRSIRWAQRRTVAAVLGVGLLICATVLYGLEAGGPLLWSIPAAAWIAGLGGVWALLAAWPRRS
jgi:ubiquinone biosynthesis protein